MRFQHDSTNRNAVLCWPRLERSPGGCLLSSTPVPKRPPPSVAARACGLNGSMHHRGWVKVVTAGGPHTPRLRRRAAACQVARLEMPPSGV
jgi:hypothetical protein